VIYSQRADEVFVTLASLLDQLEAPAPYRALFDRALGEVRRCADEGAAFLPIDMPMAVAEVLGLPAAPQRVAAAACTLLWSGADLMDDVADGELGTGWEGASPHQLALVSTNLLATLPHLATAALADHGVPEAVLSRFSQRVAQTLWEMSCGQFNDLDSERSVRSASDYGELIRQKTGAEIGLFASAPALLAGLPGDAIEAWSSFGVAYGCMAQLFSDVASSFAEPPRNDLMGGKRALPVLYTLDTLEGREREAFQRDLEASALGDTHAVARAIRRMTEQGAARFCLSRVELLRHRATQCLPIRLTDLVVDHPIRLVIDSFKVL